tara:strand:- start:15 stop:305 length:291 start_codon:yes stop_codon:yes gene_type:complete
MLFAAAGQAACMAILAGTVSNGSTSAGYVATVMLFLFNFFFAVGLLAIPWLRKFASANSSDDSDYFSARRVRTSRNPNSCGISRECIQLDLHFPSR